jgi:phosphoglycerate dehydrogenase-like enzyme
MIYQTMTAPIVAVTEPEYRKAEAVFAACKDLQCVPVPVEEQALAEAIRKVGAQHAIIGVTVYRGELYSALSAGSVLARFGVGHDGVDKDLATAAGLLCTNTPGVLDQSVAEITLFLIGAAARHVAALAGAMTRSEWAPYVGVELHGKTLVVVGLGPIGRAVAKMASFGFGMRTIGVVRKPISTLSSDREGFVSITDSYESAAAQADFLSLHIPATPANAHFLNAERLSRLSRRAWVINTARGAVVDENALYDAIQESRIAGAALDVFAREPYTPDDPVRDLRKLPHTILTPHIGSNTAEANQRIAERALANIRFAQARQFDRMDLLNPNIVTEPGP